MAEVMEVSKGAAMVAEDVKLMVEAQVAAALEKAQAMAVPQAAAPQFWWDILAVGPYQPAATTLPPAAFSGPVLPHKIIRTGHVAYVAAVLFLNPFHPSPGPSAGDILSNFALPYEISFNTGNLISWTPSLPTDKKSGNFAPGNYIYVQVLDFTPSAAGLFEMNITARVLNAMTPPTPAAPFAAFATAVLDLDEAIANVFGPGPGIQYTPLRFMVYD